MELLGVYGGLQPTPFATGCTEEPPLRKVVFHGSLRREFGAAFEIRAPSPAIALNGLMTMVPGLCARIAQGSFRITLGHPKKGRSVSDAPQLAGAWKDNEATIHIVPVIAGRGGNGGVAKIVIGVALIAVAVIAPYAAFGFAGPLLASGGTAGAMSMGVLGGFGAAAGAFTMGNLAGLGIMVALGGVAQMLSPQPKTPAVTAREAQADNPSLVFNSVVNSVEEGGVVPLVYGDVLCGSQVIAGNIVAEDISADGEASDPIVGATLAGLLSSRPSTKV